MLSFVFSLFLILGCASSSPKTDAAKGAEQKVEAKKTETKKALLKKGDEKEKFSDSAAASATASATTTKDKAEAKVADAKSVESTDKVTCKQGTEERSLEKRTAEGGGCEVIYTKGGTPSVIANAKADLSHCDKVHDKIKTNLEAVGYKCE